MHTFDIDSLILIIYINGPMEITSLNIYDNASLEGDTHQNRNKLKVLLFLRPLMNNKYMANSK